MKTTENTKNKKHPEYVSISAIDSEGNKRVYITNHFLNKEGSEESVTEKDLDEILNGSFNGKVLPFMDKAKEGVERRPVSSISLEYNSFPSNDNPGTIKIGKYENAEKLVMALNSKEGKEVFAEVDLENIMKNIGFDPVLAAEVYINPLKKENLEGDEYSSVSVKEIERVFEVMDYENLGVTEVKEDTVKIVLDSNRMGVFIAGNFIMVEIGDNVITGEQTDIKKVINEELIKKGIENTIKKTLNQKNQKKKVQTKTKAPRM